MTTLAVAVLLRRLGSGLRATAAAPTVTLPRSVASTVTAKLADPPLASEARVQVTALPSLAAGGRAGLLLQLCGEQDDGVNADRGGGPALATVSVQVPVLPVVMAAGQARAAATSALLLAGGTMVAATP